MGRRKTGGEEGFCCVGQAYRELRVSLLDGSHVGEGREHSSACGNIVSGSALCPFCNPKGPNSHHSTLEGEILIDENGPRAQSAPSYLFEGPQEATWREGSGEGDSGRDNRIHI